MFTATNTVLNDVLAKYEVSVTDLINLDAEKLRRFCEEVKVTPIYELDPRTKKPMKLDKRRTVKQILSDKSFSEYMGDTYWDEEIRVLAETYDVRKRLEAHTRGEDTFRTLAEIGVGFYQLGPGKSVEVNFTVRWLEEVWFTKPASKFVELKDEKGRKVTARKNEEIGIYELSYGDVDKETKEVEAITEEQKQVVSKALESGQRLGTPEEQEERKQIDLTDALVAKHDLPRDWDGLKEYAKKRGIKFGGRTTKKELVNQIVEQILNDNK